jgi:hypothetical protein
MIVTGKLRMQVQRIGGASSTTFYYHHLLDAVFKIARDEGPTALLRGATARIMFHVPNVAITMSLVELLRPKIYGMISGN